MQSLQASVPTVDLYFPATHGTHGPPSDPDEPALQMQSVCSLLASGALDLVGHDWHTSDVAPVTVEYSPSRQLVHSVGPVTSL